MTTTNKILVPVTILVMIEPFVMMTMMTITTGTLVTSDNIGNDNDSIILAIGNDDSDDNNNKDICDQWYITYNRRVLNDDDNDDIVTMIAEVSKIMTMII